ncbi:transposase family protein [Nonomuraea angiospora]|uniref:transposase family protein n=1 Tax=Nonomuraea angiospora TaxID=46172 RepID=UPI00344E460F
MPTPGSSSRRADRRRAIKADAHAWRDSGLPALCESATALADGVYLNTGLVVPHRRQAGRPLLRAQEDDNAEHRRIRARIEHAFPQMKNYKILRDCRQKGADLHHCACGKPRPCSSSGM